ncbi:MAG: hypothetical protein PF501_14695 [Salinisphaera sp.]|jgi:uncharacterized protein with LGFP repeats|nr:hypothetical protein [Salinisphaera sp.]
MAGTAGAVAGLNPYAASAGAIASGLGAAFGGGPSGPAVSGNRDSGAVNIGAPTFTTRPSAGSFGQTIAADLPLIAVAGVAGLVLWLTLR